MKFFLRFEENSVFPGIQAFSVCQATDLQTVTRAWGRFRVQSCASEVAFRILQLCPIPGDSGTSLPMILKATVNVDRTYFFIRHRRTRARDPQKCSNFKIRRKKMDF